MPYQKSDRKGTTKLPLPSDPDFWVEMKDRPGFGDKGAADSAIVNITQVSNPNQVPKAKRSALVVDPASGQGVLTEFEVQAYFTTLLERLIVNWNLTDLYDKVLPINAATIDELEPEDGDFLVKEAQKRLKGRSKEAEAPFEKPSLLPSPQAGDQSETARQLGS